MLQEEEEGDDDDGNAAAHDADDKDEHNARGWDRFLHRAPLSHTLKTFERSHGRELHSAQYQHVHHNLAE